MSSDDLLPKAQILKAELGVMLEKEKEMKDLYVQILDRVENNFISRKIEFLAKEEEKHMGYVEIILSLLENELAGTE
jgi:rubrerythrin